MYEVYVIGKLRFYLGISLKHHEFSAFQSRIYLLHNIFKEFERAVILSNDTFPSPLIHIKRVNVIQFLIGTYGIHIGIYAITGFETVLRQCQSFPFCKRMHNFRLHIAKILYRKLDRTFSSVKVVVDTRARRNKQRTRNTMQVQSC